MKLNAIARFKTTKQRVCVLLVLCGMCCGAYATEGDLVWYTKLAGCGGTDVQVWFGRDYHDCGVVRGNDAHLLGDGFDLDYYHDVDMNPANGAEATDPVSFHWQGTNGLWIANPYAQNTYCTFPSTAALCYLTLTADDISPHTGADDPPVSVSELTYSVDATLYLYESGDVRGCNLLIPETYREPDDQGGAHTQLMGPTNNLCANDPNRLLKGWFDNFQMVAVFSPPFMPTAAIDGGAITYQTYQGFWDQWDHNGVRTRKEDHPAPVDEFPTPNTLFYSTQLGFFMYHNVQTYLDGPGLWTDWTGSDAQLSNNNLGVADHSRSLHSLLFTGTVELDGVVLDTLQTNKVCDLTSGGRGTEWERQ